MSLSPLGSFFNSILPIVIAEKSTSLTVTCSAATSLITYFAARNLLQACNPYSAIDEKKRETCQKNLHVLNSL